MTVLDRISDLIESETALEANLNTWDSPYIDTGYHPNREEFVFEIEGQDPKISNNQKQNEEI